MKIGLKALMKWLMVPLVSALFAGSAGAATLEEWLFDQPDSTYVNNEVPGGAQLQMQYFNNVGPVFIATNLYGVGGPFPQSFDLYHPNTNVAYNRVTGTMNFTWESKTNMTIELWLKPGTPIPSAYAFPISLAGQTVAMYCWDGVHYQFWYNGYTPTNWQNTPVSPILPNNVWTHIAVTWNGTMVRAYTNGVEIPSMATSYTNLITWNSTISMEYSDLYAWGYLRGEIDEIRVSDVALPPGDGSGSNCLAWNKSLAIPATKGAGYTDGTKINLSVIDGAVATNTATVWAGQPSAAAGAINAQYHGYDEYAAYYGPSGPGVAVSPANPGTWTLQLPQPYHVSHYSFTWPWGGGYQPSNFVIQTSSDGVVWTDQASTNGNTNTTTAGDFTDVVTKYIRVKLTSLGGGSGDLWILRSACFTGSNSATVDRRVSVADANWAGASIAGNWTGVGQAIDDTVNQCLVSIATADPSASPLVVKLNGQYKVDRIGIAPLNNGTYAARNIDVYTCADYGGTNWVLVKQIRDQAYTNSAGVRWPYCPYTLDKTTLAARVKFQVLTNWGDASSTYLGELFVFPWIPPAGTRFVIR